MSGSSPQSASELPDSLLGGRYRLVQSLGGGGFGQTFLAEDLHLPGNSRCVIKRLQPQCTNPESLKTAQRLFNTEAEVLYQLGNHPQIPRLLAHFEHEQKFYLAQELVVGQPLSETLIQGQPWPEAAVIQLLHDILTTLTFVHQQNVIHRDIKPANLIRRSVDDRIVLIDFGAVKQVSTDYTESNPAVGYTIPIGTPGYMPNEQLIGMPRFSSDIYALGMIGIQALTGVSLRSLHHNRRTNDLEWQALAPQASSALVKVLTKMTRYDFRSRYSTATKALEAIERISGRFPATLPKRQEVFTLSPASASIPGTTVAYSQGSKQLLQPKQLLQSKQLLQPILTLITAVTKPVSVLRPRLTRNLLPLQPSIDVTKWRQLPLGVAAVGTMVGVIVVGKMIPPQDESPRDPATPISSSPLSSPLVAEMQPQATQVAQATLADVLLTQAEQLRQQGKAELALDQYQQVIALDAKSAEAEWGRCYSLNVLEKFAEAVAACDTAIKLQPNYAEAYWSKGYALDLQQQDQAALQLYEKAIGLKPDFAEAWSNKGTALVQLNRLTEAVAAYDRATQLKPDFAEAWSSRGAALWELRQFEAAVKSVNRALEIRPEDQTALQLRAQMRQQLGDYLRRELR